MTLQFHSRLPKDPDERKLFEALLKEGWHLSRRGWPDLFCWKDDGSVTLVKLKKHGSSTLRPSQQLILQKLANAGIPTFYWTRIHGLIRISPQVARGGGGSV